MAGFGGVLCFLCGVWPDSVGLIGVTVGEGGNGGVCEGGPLVSALNLVDKKVRNLEKRKCKLDGYRADSERGKELNSDQTSAIAKYDEDDRLKKKAAKRENVERTRSEACKISQVLRFQAVIAKTQSISDWETQSKLDSKLLTGIKAFMDLIATSETTSSCAEHFLALIDGKAAKKMGGVSYAALKDGFLSVETSLETPPPSPEPPASQEEEEEEEIVETVEEEEEMAPGTGERAEAPVAESMEEQVETPPPTQEVLVATPHVEEPQESILPVNGDHHPVPPQQEFNFLQESQIDPINMDPAVVVVQHSPPQVFNQQAHMYPMQQQVPFHLTTAAPPYHPPQPTMSHSDLQVPPQPQKETQEIETKVYSYSNASVTSQISHSKNVEVDGHQSSPAQQPTIEDWSEEYETPRENGGYLRGRGRGRGGGGGYRGPRKDNGYRGGRGGRGARSRGGGVHMNGNHYRGDKEYRGRGGRGTRGGSYRGTAEKTNGHTRE
ncbi:CAPRIN1 [Lepeophtheirus salmonis]|uniref:CAPRIN1 n=1 Tax=Lepeophtheirus salmonis TaxID=72036 RepID=A0A7R8CRT3_LEPSM|nr:CAPRIN1 [Lepeophtheirus salmonis]CAF2906458.1 CAPRIN1 [Lepeophtheirus salmonis]